MADIDRTATMTGDNAPAPNVVTASSNFIDGNYNGWKCFDKAGGFWSTAAGVHAATLTYDFGIQKWIATSYTMKGYIGNGNEYPPAAWTFLASNTGAFSGEQVTLDTQSGISNWGGVQTKTFTLTNTSVYRYYRWDITNNVLNAQQINVDELTILAHENTQTGAPFLLNFI